MVYTWETAKESAHGDVLSGLDPDGFRKRTREALDASEALLARTNDAAARVNALIAHGEALELIGDTKAANESAFEAVETARQLQEPALAAAASMSCGMCALRQGDVAEARQALTFGVGCAEEAKDQEALCLAWIGIALCDIAMGRSDSALNLLDQAFACGREQKLTAPKGYALAAVGCLYLVEERDGAAVLLSRAQLLHERAGDRLSTGRTYNNLGVYHFAQGRYVDAIPYFERALDLMNVTSDLMTLLNVLNSTVRAHELCYLERAGDLRDKMEAFASLLPQEHARRYGDLTAIPWPPRAETPDATFATDLFIAEAMILLPSPNSWLSSDGRRAYGVPLLR